MLSLGGFQLVEGGQQRATGVARLVSLAPEPLVRAVAALLDVNDVAAIDYTKAQFWQNCAQAIDPGLPEIQPKLEWE